MSSEGRHYVYALIDPRDCQAYYVGKGVSSRRFHHFKKAPMDARKNPDKVKTFKAIEEAGLQPQAIVLSWHNTQEEAYEAEKKMIALIGLDNLTNKNAGGAGKMVKEQKLTAKQEKFCQGVAKGLTYSDAYRDAYDVSNSTDKTVNERASALMADNKIATRVKELGAPVVEELRQELKITKESLLLDMERAKRIAEDTDQVSAMIAAGREQGKMLDIYPAEKRENKNINVNDVADRIAKGRQRVAKLKVVGDD